MAKLGILQQEKKLKQEIFDLEKKIHAAQADGDKKHLESLKSQKSVKEDELDTFKLENQELRESLNLGKQIVTSSKSWNNTLKGNSKIVMGVQSLMVDINTLSNKTDKRSKKIGKSYMGWVTLTDDVLRNFELMGTSEFTSLNINTEILKAQRLIASEKEGQRKEDLKMHLETLRSVKTQQDLYKSIHDTAGESAKIIMGPLSAVQNALGQVPVVGGLFANMFDLEGIQENLTKKIADSMKGGFDTAEPTVYFDEISQRWKDTNTNRFVGDKKAGEMQADFIKKQEKQARLNKMRIAGLGVVVALWAKITKFAFDTGLSIAQTAKLGPQLVVNSQAVEAFAEEFGTVGELNFGIAKDLRIQRFLYGAQEKDVAKIVKLQQGLTGETKAQIVADLPGMYKEARKAGVSPAKLTEQMANNTEFLAKYVGGSAKEMGRFAIEAAKSGVSLQTLEASMKGALDWETSINKEMEASVMLGKQVNLDRFRQLSFAGDEQGALQEQLRIIRSMGPLDKLRVDQKEVLADLFSTEFSQIVALQREQDILNDSVNKQQSVWSSVVGLSGTAMTTMVGAMPSILNYGAQIGDIFSGIASVNLPKMIKGLKSFNIVQRIAAALGWSTAASSVTEAGANSAASAAKIPYVGWLLAAGAMGSIMTLGFQWLSKGKAQGRAMGGPVKAMNPYMVGERGPELMIPATAGNIIPNNRLASGTADRVYGDTSGLQGLMAEIRDGILAGNVDRNKGNRDTRKGIEGIGGF